MLQSAGAGTRAVASRKQSYERFRHGHSGGGVLLDIRRRCWGCHWRNMRSAMKTFESGGVEGHARTRRNGTGRVSPVQGLLVHEQRQAARQWHSGCTDPSRYQARPALVALTATKKTAASSIMPIEEAPRFVAVITLLPVPVLAFVVMDDLGRMCRNDSVKFGA